jgi:site-specific recombinase XerD
LNKIKILFNRVEANTVFRRLQGCFARTTAASPRDRSGAWRTAFGGAVAAACAPQSAAFKAHAMDYRQDSPQLLLDFLSYHETIKAHSQRTVDEYYLDLRNFFRYLKQQRDPALSQKRLDEIDIRDVDLTFISRITLTDIYSYLTYLSRDRVQHQNSENSNKGLNAASRARKLATIRSFFNYICNKRHLLEENPCKDVDTPKQMKSLPRYLTLNESLSLLDAVDGANRERDYCILTLFLNCGLRISELIGLNISDIHDDALRILGKGSKVRVVYLNQACKDALTRYLAVRRPITGRDRDALFLSGQNKRISRSMVHTLVKKHLSAAGLDSEKYSSHKLRHTAATLMLQNGVDVKAVQEVLGHEHLNTTEIYTHIDNEALRVAAKANPLSHVKMKGKIEDTDTTQAED